MKKEPPEYNWGGSIASPDTFDDLEPKPVQPYTSRRNIMLGILIVQQSITIDIFWQIYQTESFG